MRLLFSSLRSTETCRSSESFTGPSPSMAQLRFRWGAIEASVTVEIGNGADPRRATRKKRLLVCGQPVESAEITPVSTVYPAV